MKITKEGNLKISKQEFRHIATQQIVDRDLPGPLAIFAAVFSADLITRLFNSKEDNNE